MSSGRWRLALGAEGLAPGDALLGGAFLRVEEALVLVDLAPLLHGGLGRKLSARRLGAKAPLVFAPSRHAKVVLQTLFGFRAERVWTMPPPPGTEHPTAGDGGILCVGPERPWRRWAPVLAALADSGACFRFADAEAADHPAIREAAREAGIAADRIAFGGDGAIRLIAAPSVCEAFSWAAADAAASGAAQLAPALPPVSESPPANAFLYDADDGAAIARAAAAALACPPGDGAASARGTLGEAIRAALEEVRGGLFRAGAAR